MIEIDISPETKSVLRSVEKNRTLLIIGSDANRYAVNNILYYESIEKAINDYGESELTDAFKIAQEFGVKGAFLLNNKDKRDYIDIFTMLKQYDFAYITPVNLYASDYFYNINENGKKVFFANDYISRSASFNHSLMLMTDKHASLYEHIDDYINEMKLTVSRLKEKIKIQDQGKNLAIVANNLKNYTMANVVIASILASSGYGEYPTIERKLPAIFNIDLIDVGDSEIIFFKNHVDRSVTIENLVNMEKEYPMLKSIYVDRIIKYIIRTLDMTALHGNLYREYHKLQAEKMLEKYFNTIEGSLIRKYKIESIKFIHEQAGVGYLECIISVWVKSTSEKFTLRIGK